MRAVIVIPARYASSRFPGKPLAPLTGATGVDKPLIRRSWEAARAVGGVARVVVATDDGRIAQAARGFGAEVAMTSPEAANGTERCAEALGALGDVDAVVNLQGDAPLTPPWFIEALLAELAARPGIDVATPVLRVDEDGFEALRADRRAGRVGATTAVVGSDGAALYFSKEMLPYISPDTPFAAAPPVLHHVGVYAYRPEALRAYAGWPQGVLERAEGLEQLRFLERGVRVACVEVDARGQGFWEINHPGDRDRIESALRARGVA